MKAIEVRSDIGIPKPKWKGKPNKYPFATMAVGEMFFLPGQNAPRFSSYTYLWGKRLGRTFSTRTIFMRLVDGAWTISAETAPDAVVGTGVWRIA